MTNDRSPSQILTKTKLRAALILFGLSIGFVTTAQNFGGVRLNIDEFKYESVEISVGDTIQLGSGSDVNGFFSFVDGFTKAGRGSRPFRPSNEYSNSTVVVTHFVTYGLDPVPICKSTSSEDRRYALYFKVANLEGAILNDELVLAAE